MPMKTNAFTDFLKKMKDFLEKIKNFFIKEYEYYNETGKNIKIKKKF